MEMTKGAPENSENALANGDEWFRTERCQRSLRQPLRASRSSYLPVDPLSSCFLLLAASSLLPLAAFLFYFACASAASIAA
jgi:hypothetical protein